MDTLDEAITAYLAPPHRISVYYYDTINETKI